MGRLEQALVTGANSGIGLGGRANAGRRRGRRRGTLWPIDSKMANASRSWLWKTCSRGS